MGNEHFVSELMNGLLGKYKERFDLDSVGVAETAFSAALSSLADTQLMARADEETSTGAFLGALTSSYRASALAFHAANGGVSLPECSWATYSKGGSGERWSAEAQIGADFAIVIWENTKIGWLAVFQAKRVDSDADLSHSHIPSSSSSVARSGISPQKMFIDVHRRPPRDGQPLNRWRRTQMFQLFNFGKDIITAQQLLVSGDGPSEEKAKNLANMLSNYRAPLPKIYHARKVANAVGLRSKGKGIKERFSVVHEELSRWSSQKKQDFAREQLIKDARKIAYDERKEKIEDFQKEGREFHSASKRDMDWIHYVGYVREEQFTHMAKSPLAYEPALCISLNHLGSWLTLESQENRTHKNFVDLAAVPCVSLASLLFTGASNSDSRPGWLKVEHSLIKAMLPRLQEFGPVLMMEAGRKNVLQPKLADPGSSQSVGNASRKRAPIAELTPTPEILAVKHAAELAKPVPSRGSLISAIQASPIQEEPVAGTDEEHLDAGHTDLTSQKGPAAHSPHVADEKLLEKKDSGVTEKSKSDHHSPTPFGR